MCIRTLDNNASLPLPLQYLLWLYSNIAKVHNAIAKWEVKEEIFDGLGDIRVLRFDGSDARFLQWR
jgi:hypothetical protein